jgi:Zn-dependent protease with chaperone function
MRIYEPMLVTHGRRLRTLAAALATTFVLGGAALGCKSTDEKATNGATRSDRDKAGDRNGGSCDWIPSNAAEVTAVSSLHADAENDPTCMEHATALDIPKGVAVSIERELRESTKMSDEDEARIGAKLEAALPRERTFAGKLDLPEDVRRYKSYARDIIQNLASKSSRPNLQYRIHTVRSPVFNAAAMPGGVILVFTGLFEGREAVHDEAELAGVLAHEITHVERRHVVAAYQFARAALGDESDEAVLAMRVITQPLSTEHELEADERGMELMTLAGYDPQAVVNVWRRNAKAEAQPGHARQGGDPDDGDDPPRRRRGRHGRRGRRHDPRDEGRDGQPDVLNQVLEGVQSLMRTHPPAAVRACHAVAKLAWVREHAPCDRLYDGRSNLQSHVAGPKHPY